MIPENPAVSLETIQKVIDYMEENLCGELTPADIAAHFYMSTSAVAVLFKTVCGMTLMEYVRNRRLTLAAEELVRSDIHVIDLAYKYGYETPEAFTKAFSRFHGFPPSFVRRGVSLLRAFQPLRICVSVTGGWEEVRRIELTKADARQQDFGAPSCYDDLTIKQGGKQMKHQYQIDVRTMKCQKEWRLLHALAGEMQQRQIPFKVDGKTMIFAHGLEFPLDKICLTFKWKDEAAVKEFFCHEDGTKGGKEGFKYFDVLRQGMKIRCMFYGGCPGDDTDAFLYRNTDMVQIDDLTVPVQSLEFFYENAEKDTESYRMVEAYLRGL